jgi:hypothetical protein
MRNSSLVEHIPPPPADLARLVVAGLELARRSPACSSPVGPAWSSPAWRSPGRTSSAGRTSPASGLPYLASSLPSDRTEPLSDGCLQERIEAQDAAVLWPGRRRNGTTVACRRASKLKTPPCSWLGRSRNGRHRAPLSPTIFDKIY